MPDFVRFLEIKHQILLWHSFAIVLLVHVLLLFVKVVQLLVQWLNEQLEILQTFLDIAASPERQVLTLSSVFLTLMLRNVFLV